MKNNLNAVTVHVVIYYAITVAGGQLLLYFFPESRSFLPVGGIDKLNDASILDLVNGDSSVIHTEADQFSVLTLLLTLIGTVIFSIPLSWVYIATQTKKKYKNNPIIETIYLLPIIVACVAIIVQHSIALAFGLVGIVAAVQFRNTVKTPSDAVFIFASLTIGLAAGVSEIVIAGIGSMVFSFTALSLIHFKVVDLDHVKKPKDKPFNVIADINADSDSPVVIVSNETRPQ
jgi:hypothetical protein